MLNKECFNCGSENLHATDRGCPKFEGTEIEVECKDCGERFAIWDTFANLNYYCLDDENLFGAIDIPETSFKNPVRKKFRGQGVKE